MRIEIKAEDIKLGDKIQIKGNLFILDEGKVTKIATCQERYECPLPLAGGCIGIGISIDNKHAWCAKTRRKYFVETESNINKVTEI